jgi:hypothetical protein
VSVLILARTARESAVYAQEHGISRRVRHAYTVHDARSHSVTEIIELPSFSERRESHVIRKAVEQRVQARFTRPATYEVDAEWDYAAVRARRQAEREQAEADRLAGRTSEHRDKLVDAANAAVEALAEHLGYSVERTLAEALGDVEHIEVMSAGSEEPVMTIEVPTVVGEVSPDGEPFVLIDVDGKPTEVQAADVLVLVGQVRSLQETLSARGDTLDELQAKVETLQAELADALSKPSPAAEFDPEVLKAELKQYGYTLKKLPQKAGD